MIHLRREQRDQQHERQSNGQRYRVGAEHSQMQAAAATPAPLRRQRLLGRAGEFQFLVTAWQLLSIRPSEPAPRRQANHDRPRQQRGPSNGTASSSFSRPGRYGAPRYTACSSCPRAPAADRGRKKWDAPGPPPGEADPKPKYVLSTNVTDGSTSVQWSGEAARLRSRDRRAATERPARIGRLHVGAVARKSLQC